MAEQEFATRQDINELRQAMKEFRDDIMHQLGIIAERLEHKIELLLEQAVSINNKLDQLIANNKRDHERLDNKIDRLTMEITEHRNNTETHIVKPKSKRKA